MFIKILMAMLPFVGLAVNVSCQVILFRYVLRKELLKSIIMGFILGFIVVSAAYLVVESKNPALTDFLAVLAVNLLAYAALGYCYFHFVNLGETARRIRIMREVYDAGGHLSLEGIITSYNSKEIIQKRLGRLLNSGQIIYKEGSYFLGKPVMFYIAKIIVALKVVVLAKRSEFDK